MKTKIVIAVGLAGILLIFVSEMFPAKNTAIMVTEQATGMKTR